MTRLLRRICWPLVSLVLLTSFNGCKSDDDSKPDDGSGGASSGGSPNLTCDITVDTTTYDYDLRIDRSSNPPGGLAPVDVPQFVALGWDDNGFLDPFDWSIRMLEERGLTASYFMTTTYISDRPVVLDSDPLRASWRAAYDQGNEIGHHTQYHLDAQPPTAEDPPFTSDDWAVELDTGFDWLTAPFESEEPTVELGLGIPRNEIYGFRSPFLHYNDALFPELKERGIWYDCSIEEGWQLDEDASKFTWPYTLDQGSAAHDYAQERGFESRNFDLGSHPGMIELPAYALVIPPDDVADDYDISPGLLDRIRDYIPEREPGSDRITGLDYNLWWEAHLTKEEALAILKYNLDQRLSGNRAPFLFGVHTDFYRENWGSDETFDRRRAAIEEFLDYAKSLPDVRIVTYKEVADFMRQPRPLDCFDSVPVAGGAGGAGPR